MAEAWDSAIKLFGTTIPLHPSGEPPPVAASGGAGSGGEDEKESDTNESATESRDNELPDSEEKTESEFSKTSSADKEESPTKNSAPETQSSYASSPKENPPTKPDKILACPRCSSTDTKFCYYNNYNTNQPRHFCKNCQRYWTAGGTMRNVPVGAGRRKHKSSASQYQNITVPESCLQAVQSNAGGSIVTPSKTNTTVLRFDQCNQLHQLQNAKEHSTTPSLTGSNPKEEGGEIDVGVQPFPCLRGSSWHYPWSFAVPIYPAAGYWGCMVPGAWNTPWPPSPLASANGVSAASVTSSQSLGKHSRDGGDNDKETNQDRCIWAPKTLRIDDINEAAMSSIWATLGIKSDKAGTCSRGRPFKMFEPKGDVKNHAIESARLLHANPAALSRSLDFQESA